MKRSLVRACARAFALASVACSTLVPAAARAQVGRLTQRVEYAVVRAPSVASHAGERLDAIVLWRGDSTARARWGGDDARRHQEYVEARYQAERAGRSAFGSSYGGSATLGEIDSGHLALRVLGQSFALAHGDSTLVLMVDRVDGVGGPPTVRGALWTRDSLPASYWERSWSSGDTTFYVRPSWPRQQQMLLELLRRQPAVAEFLR